MGNSVFIGNFTDVQELRDAVFNQFKSMYHYDRDSDVFSSETVFAQEVYEDIMTFINGAEQLVPGFLSDDVSFVELSKDYCLNTDFGNCIITLSYASAFSSELSWMVHFNLGHRTCAIIEIEGIFPLDLRFLMIEDFYCTIERETHIDLP